MKNMRSNIYYCPACGRAMCRPDSKRFMKSHCTKIGATVIMHRMESIQLGSFVFGFLDGERLFISLDSQGEGGYFNLSDLPQAIQKLLSDPATSRKLTPTGHRDCDRLMYKFWREHF